MNAEIYKIISITGFILAAVMFIASVILFFKLNIQKVIGDLTGKTARKAIQNIREQNSQTGNKAYKPSPVNIKRGKLTDKISPSGRLIEKGNDMLKVSTGTEKIYTQELSGQDKMESLDEASADTEVLDITQQLGMISESSSGHESDMQAVLELDITFLHTDEVIL